MRPVRLIAILTVALGAVLVSGVPAGATDGEDVVIRDFSLLERDLGALQDGPRILGGGTLSF